MPGIFGLTKKGGKGLNNLSQLNIQTNEKVHQRLDFENDFFINALVNFDFQKDYSAYRITEELEVWLFGDPLIEGVAGNKAYEKAIKLIIDVYPNFNGLVELDGLFNVLIYDKIEKKIFILNDRNGLAHIFYGFFDDQLIWGSELRAFISNKLNLTIGKEYIYDFLNLGYLINNDTWFDEIQLLPPASYIEWDLEKSELLRIEEYWSHKNLKKNSIQKNKKEIIDDLKDLFEQAVAKRVNDEERVGITLSGGLDSRLIFANIPVQKNRFTAITRGMENAGDIKLAKKVVQRRIDCEHILKYMYSEDWIEGREKAIKVTSGQKDLFNMNAISSLPIHKKYFDINLDGAGGDGIFTGGHLKYENSKDLQKSFEDTYFRNKFKNNNSIKKFITYYNNVDSDQFFYIYERIRRFTIFGSILGHDYGIITRFPFLDNQLQDYFYQLDSNLDVNKLYYKMLIKYFPEYFIEIDSLDTGTRLYSSPNLNLIVKAKNRLFEKFGIKKYQRKYHDYPRWLRDKNKEFVKQYLLDENLYLYNFIPYSQIENITNQFLAEGNGSALVSRALSLSIFLEDYRVTINNEEIIV